MAGADTTLFSIQQAFGGHPGDVIYPISDAAAACHWLAEIFKTIEQEIDSGGDVVRIRNLAQMGGYVAADKAAYLESEHETRVDALKECGLAG